MQREWKSEGEESPASDAVDVTVEIDQDIVEAYKRRWPGTWRERMAAVLVASAAKLSIVFIVIESVPQYLV